MGGDSGYLGRVRRDIILVFLGDLRFSIRRFVFLREDEVRGLGVKDFGIVWYNGFI